MTKTEILLAMHKKAPLSLFCTMQIGGNMRQLSKLEADGLVSSQHRYSRGGRQRDWYLSEEQHASLSFLFAEPT